MINLGYHKYVPHKHHTSLSYFCFVYKFKINTRRTYLLHQTFIEKPYVLLLLSARESANFFIKTQN